MDLEVALSLGGGVEVGAIFWEKAHSLNQEALLKSLGRFARKADLFRSIVLEGLRREPWEVGAFITAHHEGVVAAFPYLKKAFRHEEQHTSHLADRFRVGIEYLITAAKFNAAGARAALVVDPIQKDEYRVLLASGYGYANNLSRVVAVLTGLQYVETRCTLRWDEEPMKALVARLDRGLGAGNLPYRFPSEI